MPKAYESMKREFMSDGMSDKAAEKKAARIFNASRKTGQRIVSPRGENARKKSRSKKR